jgi:hypothetical protein
MKIDELSQIEIDNYYEHLTVVTWPSGSYSGVASSKTLPIGSMNYFWKGKVFVGLTVRNRILGMQLIEGVVLFDKTGDELIIDYPQLHLQDRMRQIDEETYLGRMELGSNVINFVLTKDVK